MTNDENETARELIDGVFIEAAKDAPTANNATELLELIVSSLRDETDFIDSLKTKQTALIEIGIQELGKNPADSDKHLAMCGIQVLAYSDTPAPVELLNRIHNDARQALALAHYAELPTGDTALLLMVAVGGELYAAVGEINNDRNVTAFALDPDNLDERGHSPAMAAATRALQKASERRSQ